MQPDSPKLLYDIKSAAEEIEEFFRDCGREEFLGNRLLQVAAERELEIMGEALNRLSRVDEETFFKVENGPKIIGLRNILAHGYDVIDYRIIWEILQNDIGPLHNQIRDLLRE